MTWKTFIPALLLTVSAHSLAYAQAAAPPARPWSVDFGIGWDKSISGNINSSGIGTFNNQTTVILKNRYEDVYGTGLHLRFGGGYLIKENVEVRATFTFQSLDADLVRMGDFGASNLYGQYADYQSFGLDVGYRYYVPLKPGIRAYGEATIGLAFVDETDVILTAPQANLTGVATDFYDRTSAFALGINGGVLFALTPKVDAFVQTGLRRVSGMSEVDAFAGTGLETINDNSSRWSLPFAAGVRFRF